jgi:hypothetical protein
MKKPGMTGFFVSIFAVKLICSIAVGDLALH